MRAINGLAIFGFVLLLLLPAVEVEGQWRGPDRYSRFMVERDHPLRPGTGILTLKSEEGEAAEPSFLGRVGRGSLAGLVSGALLGSLITDWSLSGGAGVGLVTGSVTGLVVAVAAENGRMTKTRGFLMGAVPAYATWILLGAPVDFPWIRSSSSSEG